MRLSLIRSAAFLVLFADGLALAQPNLGNPSGDSNRDLTLSQLNEEARRGAAQAFFVRGIQLMADKAWEAALAAFQQANEIFLTRQAVMNAGTCLRELHRFDEARDTFQLLITTFPDLPPKDLSEATAQIAYVSAHIGNIVIVGGVPESKVVVNGRDRGRLDSSAAWNVPVSAGSHMLRLVRDGYQTFEVQVRVVGGQSVTVPIDQQGLVEGGVLQVREARNGSAQVIVDGAMVGMAPWAGTLTPGTHVVALRTTEAMGTQPRAVEVKLNGSSDVLLRLEPLRATLRVIPFPADATVVLDGVNVGRGTWTGRVREGEHTLNVRAEGYVPIMERVTTPRDSAAQREVHLDSLSEFGHMFIEASARYAVAFSWGGDLINGCSAECDAETPMGFELTGHWGYEFAPGLAILMDVGYVSVRGTVHDRPISLHAQGLADNLGTATDALKLSGARIGPSAEIRRGKRLFWGARLGTGLLLGTTTDSRSGSASTNERTDASTGEVYPAQTYSFHVTENVPARYLYVAPEARVGIRFNEQFDLAASVEVLVLVALNHPTWGDESPVLPGADYHVGLLRFGPEQILGDVAIAVAPGVIGRMAF